MFSKWSLIFSALIFLRISGLVFGQGCDLSGVKCISCFEYQKCNAGVVAEEIISCSGDVCVDDNLNLCKMKLNCFSGSECTQMGIFPDLMDDSKYYVCLSDGATGFLKYDFTCPEESFFDKNTLTCALKAVTSGDPPIESPSSEVSESPTEPSSEPPSTESSSDPSTESSVTPSTESSSDPSTESSSASPTESSSDPTTESSVTPSTESSSDPSTESSSTESSSTSTTESSSVPSSSTEPSTSPMTSTQPPTFTCMTSGIFPNPTNCKMYYRCSTSLKIFNYICPGNSYFNENILKCSLTITPACQEQILKNSTSTLPPGTTTTSTTTTTLPPTTTTTTTTASTTSTTSTTPSTTTTTTPTTTTTTPATTPTPICLTSGLNPSPLDCKSYYRCSTSGKIFHYVCPGNTYFNEITMRCSSVITPRCKTLLQG